MNPVQSWQLAVEHDEDLKREDAPRKERLEAHMQVMIRWMQLVEYMKGIK